MTTIIASLSLLAALVLVANGKWPNARVARVFAASLVFGVSYTIFSDWLNTTVRGSWAYSDWMPIVPGIGTGLAPLNAVASHSNARALDRRGPGAVG